MKKIKQINPATMSPLALALAACGGGGGGTSTGTMAQETTFPLTGNKFKDATTQGSKWSPENNILTYAVANGFNGEQWDNISTVNSQLTLAMQQVAQFTNLKVQNLGNFSDATEAANAGAGADGNTDGLVGEEAADAGCKGEESDGGVPSGRSAAVLARTARATIASASAGVPAGASTVTKPTAEPLGTSASE